MTQRKALVGWETRVGTGTCEVTPQAIWPIAKSLLKRDGPKTPVAIHGHSDLALVCGPAIATLLHVTTNSSKSCFSFPSVSQYRSCSLCSVVFHSGTGRPVSSALIYITLRHIYGNNSEPSGGRSIKFGPAGGNV
jgi:hypothetical protein